MEIKDEQILFEFNQLLQEYTSWVNMKIKFNKDWDEEIFYIIGCRDELFALSELAKSRALTVEIDILYKIDKILLNQFNATKDLKYKFDFDRSDVNKYKWWYWMDEIDNLSKINPKQYYG